MKLLEVVRSGAFAGILFAGLQTLHAQAVATPPPPAHPVTTEQVRRLMSETHTTDLMQSAMHTMIEQQRQTTPMLPAGFWADFEVEMAKIDWVAIATPVYQKYLSQDDAEKMIAFYGTEAGQHAIMVSSAVMNEMSQKGFELGKDIGTRVGMKYAEEIQRNMQNARPATPPQPN